MQDKYNLYFIILLNRQMTQSHLMYWGSNQNGLLNPLSAEKSFCVPQSGAIPFDVAILSASQKHVSFITNDGDVYSFGSNLDGRLGCGGSSSLYFQIFNPVHIPLPAKAIDIQCGFSHVCAILSNNQVYSWGLGQYGALGTSDFKCESVPRKVKTQSRITNISCGAMHTALLDTEGNVFMCGSNEYGQLGVKKPLKIATPSIVGMSVKVSKVACGVFYTLLLGQNSKVYGMGNNNYGQLGIGHKINQFYPTAIKEIDNVCDIAAGYHSGAVDRSGYLYIWGSGSFGEFLKPKKYTLNTKCQQIYIRGFFGIVLSSDKKLHVWGNNNCGQLGSGNYENAREPTEMKILAGANIKAITCSVNFVIVIVQGFGDNEKRQTRQERLYQTVPKDNKYPLIQGDHSYRAVKHRNYYSGRQQYVLPASYHQRRTHERHSQGHWDPYSRLQLPRSAGVSHRNHSELRGLDYSKAKRDSSNVHYHPRGSTQLRGHDPEEEAASPLRYQRKNLSRNYQQLFNSLSNDYDKLLKKYQHLEYQMSMRSIGTPEAVKRTEQQARQEEFVRLLRKHQNLQAEYRAIRQELNQFKVINKKIQNELQIAIQTNQKHHDQLIRSSQLKALVERLKANEEMYKANEENFRLNQEKYKANEIRYRANEERYKLNQERYQVNEGNYKANEARYKANEERYKANEDKFKADEKRYKQNQERFRLSEQRYKVNEQKHQVDEKTWRINQQRYKRNEQTYKINEQKYRANEEKYRENEERLKILERQNDVLKDRCKMAENEINLLNQRQRLLQSQKKQFHKITLEKPQLQRSIEQLNQLLQIRQKKQQQAAEHYEKEHRSFLILRESYEQLQIQHTRLQDEYKIMLELMESKKKVETDQAENIHQQIMDLRMKELNSKKSSSMIENQLNYEKQLNRRLQTTIRQISDIKDHALRENENLKELMITAEKKKEELSQENQQNDRYREHINQLEIQLQRVKEAYHQEKQSLALTLQRKQQILENLEKELGNQDSGWKNKLQQKNTETKQLHDTVEDYEQQLKLQREEHRKIQAELTNKIQELQNAINREEKLVRKCRHFQEEMEKELKEREAVFSQMNVIRRQNTRIKMAKDQMEKDKDVLENEKNSLKMKLSAKDGDIAAFDQQYQELLRQNQDLKQYTNRQEESIEELRNTNSELIRIKDEVIGANQTFEGNQLKLNEKCTALQNRIYQMQNQQKAFPEHYEALLQRNKELDERNKELGQMINKAIEIQAEGYRNSILKEVELNTEQIIEAMKDEQTYKCKGRRRQEPEILDIIPSEHHSRHEVEEIQQPYTRMSNDRMSIHQRRISESARKLAGILELQDKGESSIYQLSKRHQTKKNNTEDLEKINSHMESLQYQKDQFMAKINSFAQKLKIL